MSRGLHDILIKTIINKTGAIKRIFVFLSMEKKFAIVDIETTGGLYRRDKIIEIGIVLVENQEIIDEFSSLIHPGFSIPYNITRITGIHDAMVSSAPKFYEVAKEIVQWTENHIFVAHNVRFDYSFIRQEFEDLAYTYSRKQLCTARLSRSLLPQLGRYNLDNLIQHFGISIKNRHRALDDARATAQIFIELLRIEAGQQSIQHLVNYGLKESRLPENIHLDKLHALPEQCGVYYMHDRNGQLVYIGKSNNIKKRIFQHFAEWGQKGQNMQTLVNDISYEITGSELIALIKEEDEIKKFNPLINKAQRRKPRKYFIGQHQDETGYLHLNLRKAQDGEWMAKSFTLRQHGSQFLKFLAEEHQLCWAKLGLQTSPGPCFLHQIGKCFGACTAEEDAESYNKRVLACLEQISPTLEGSFIILEDGRRPGERALIWVENGTSKGYGYVDTELVEDALKHPDQMVSVPDNQGRWNQIIHVYLKKNKPKVIYYPSPNAAEISC